MIHYQLHHVPFFQNSEMLAEGELRSNLDESDRVRDLQDKVAELKAEVGTPGSFWSVAWSTTEPLINCKYTSSKSKGIVIISAIHNNTAHDLSLPQ